MTSVDKLGTRNTLRTAIPQVIKLSVVRFTKLFIRCYSCTRLALKILEAFCRCEHPSDGNHGHLHGTDICESNVLGSYSTMKSFKSLLNPITQWRVYTLLFWNHTASWSGLIYKPCLNSSKKGHMGNFLSSTRQHQKLNVQSVFRLFIQNELFSTMLWSYLVNE